MQHNTIITGDSADVLKSFQDNYFDSMPCDAPYGLGKAPDPAKMLSAWLDTGHLNVSGGGFMGKEWDSFVPQPAFWREAMRVLKPGAHVACFFGTRTYDWGVMAMRIAGFEIRDQLAWVFAQGFPKSHNLHDSFPGFGTALKPAYEPIVLARKPLEKGLTVEQNMIKWGTGALNIDGSRIESEGWVFGTQTDIKGGGFGSNRPAEGKVYAKNVESNPLGRWPANLMHDGSQEVLSLFPESKGQQGALTGIEEKKGNIYGAFNKVIAHGMRNDNGSAARFFFCAKTSKRERTCNGAVNNAHPTVKPVAVMRWLTRLITPPHGIIIDPFIGSGTTAIAANEEGFRWIGIDQDEESVRTATERIASWKTPKEKKQKNQQGQRQQALKT